MVWPDMAGYGRIGWRVPDREMRCIHQAARNPGSQGGKSATAQARRRDAPLAGFGRIRPN